MKIRESMKLNPLILKPDHRSRINWVFNSGLRISISVGVLGAVGILLVIKAKRYLEFSISDKVATTPRSWVVPGLENLGNNCFLNAVLQRYLYGDGSWDAGSWCRIMLGGGFSKLFELSEISGEMMEEYGSSPVEEGDENVPLVNSLTSLLEELCIIRHKRTVLSPRNLMHAMDHYIPNFNLARQQDAEEAFSHLLSSLREEISEDCLINKSSLADLLALPNSRILSARSSESEWQRWSRSYLKPFDGILGSILICKSCSFQISLDYELFHSLHISPPAINGGAIMAGCTLEDCLRRFFVAEHVENYFCSNCWHNSAVVYLSAFAEDKRDIEKLQSCCKNERCECIALPSLEAFPWLNRFSRTFKQLSIARSPKILCIHLQRASYNVLGQSVKLTGHISFPMILDLSLFMNTGVGIKIMDANSRLGPSKQSSHEVTAFPYHRYQAMPVDLRTLTAKASTAENISSESEAAGEEDRNAIIVKNGFLSCSISGTDGNADVIVPASPPQRQIYRLVSVVEHFGTSGAGHYTVYRKVTAKIGGDEEDSVALLESAIDQWFCISDSEVCSVSDKDVLAANASMLFYEKISNS